jgi:medium-chain acyl-[acyl-carrier-protein] hydrolase
MDVQSIWREELSIKFSETDFQQNWKPSAFFSAMQEVGSLHATHLGYDYRDMFAANMSWVLSRVKIKFNAFPKTGQKVTIQTWPKGIHNKLFFMRDFFFLSENGSQLAAATCAFVLIDINARRVLPWRVLKGSLPDNRGLSAIEQFPERLDIPDEKTECFSIQTSYSDVDLMGHVNNARYIEWISNCFPLQQYQSHQLEWLQVNYLNEIKTEVHVSIGCASDEKDASINYVLGKNLTTGNTAFEAALRWR